MFPYLFVRFLTSQLNPSKAGNSTQGLKSNSTIDQSCVDHFQVTSFLSGIVFTVFFVLAAYMIYCTIGALTKTNKYTYIKDKFNKN